MADYETISYILGGLGALYATGRLIRYGIGKWDERVAKEELDKILAPEQPEDPRIVELLSQLETTVREEVDRLEELAPRSPRCHDLQLMLTAFRQIDYRNRKVDKMLLRGIHHICVKYNIEFPDPAKIAKNNQKDL